MRRDSPGWTPVPDQLLRGPTFISLMAGLTATSACEAVAAQSASAHEGEDQWDPANLDFWISIEKPLNLGQGLQFVAEEEIEFGQPLLRTEDPQTRMVP